MATSKTETNAEYLQVLHLVETHTTHEIAKLLGRSRAFVTNVMRRHKIGVKCRYTPARIERETGYCRSSVTIMARSLSFGRFTPGGRLLLTENERDSIVRAFQTVCLRAKAGKRRRGSRNPVGTAWHAAQKGREGLEVHAVRGRQTILATRTYRSKSGKRCSFQVKYGCECGNRAWTDASRFKRWKTDKCKSCPKPGTGFRGTPLWAKHGEAVEQ